MAGKWSRLGVAVTMAALVALGFPSAAHADPLTGVTCSIGTFANKFDPGVKLTPAQDIHSTTEYRFTTCVSASEPLLSSGTADYSQLLRDFTCVNLPLPLDATFNIKWDIGQDSRVSVTNYVFGATVFALGNVKSGLFAGKSVTIALQAFPITAPAECLTDGIKLITGSATIDIG